MCLRADWLPALSYQRSKLTNCSLIRLSLIFFPQEIRIFYSDKAEKFQAATRPNPRGFPPPAARRSPRAFAPPTIAGGAAENAGAEANAREGGGTGARRGAERRGGKGRLRARQGEPEAAARGGVGAGRSGGLTAYLQPDLPGAPVRHATPRVVGCKRGQRSSLRRRDPGGTSRGSPAPALSPHPPRGAPCARPGPARRGAGGALPGAGRPGTRWRGSREAAA